MLKWTDKTDGIDDIIAEDVNKLAHSIIENENTALSLQRQTEENTTSIENLASEITNTDETPTKDSDNLITSGGVYDVLEKPLKPFVITLEEDCESITIDKNDIEDFANLGDMYITFFIPETATTATSSHRLYICFNDITAGSIASWCHKDYVLRATLYSTKVNDFRYVISSTLAGANIVSGINVGVSCNLVDKTNGLPQKIVNINSIKIKTSNTNLLIPKGTIITIGGYVK